MALALVMKIVIDKNEETTVLHMTDEQPTILRRAIKILALLLDEMLSYTEDIGVYLKNNKQSKMILCSNFCRVNGMEFDHVVIVVNQSEYYLKYYLPQAISRCTYDLTFILLPGEKMYIEEGFLQKVTSFVSRTRNYQTKETVANMIEELKSKCLVKQVTVAECKACENDGDCFSISSESDDKQLFWVHTHSDQYNDYLFHFSNFEEKLEKEAQGANATTVADTV